MLGKGGKFSHPWEHTIVCDQGKDVYKRQGLVVRRHGSGTYVARKDVHHETSNLTGLAEVLRKQGKELSLIHIFIYIVCQPMPSFCSITTRYLRRGGVWNLKFGLTNDINDLSDEPN